MSIENIFPIGTDPGSIVQHDSYRFSVRVRNRCYAGIKDLTDRELVRAFQGMDGIIQRNQPFL